MHGFKHKLIEKLLVNLLLAQFMSSDSNAINSKLNFTFITVHLLAKYIEFYQFDHKNTKSLSNIFGPNLAALVVFISLLQQQSYIDSVMPLDNSARSVDNKAGHVQLLKVTKSWIICF